LSEKIGKTAQEIIKQLLLLGIPTTINSVVDFATMELVAGELGVEIELKIDKTKEEILVAGHEESDDESDLVKRPPVITVMGHVDHGKTSLLDRIRKTNVATGEAGGITQAIGAYSVTVRDEKITFLDTPGHEAFTEMRARGASVTDIAVLVVAADDGIMPQTVEAVNHAKAAGVPVIVAINKIDKPGANIPKIREMLTEYGLVAEEWGGDTMIVPISATTGENIDKLLEAILLLAEVNNYRANPKRLARGSVIEARLDRGRGPVANVIVQNGTLRVGDTLVSGTAVGRVRAMTDDKGRAIKEAGPSTPVSILGLTEVPNAGDPVLAVPDEKIAREVASERIARQKIDQIASGPKATLEDLLQAGEGKLKELNILIKADVQGSAEALKNSLDKLQNEEAKVKVIHTGVGAVNKSDIMLAGVGKAIIVGFNVRADAESKSIAESSGIDIRTYRVIYEAIEDITAILSGMITPKFRENITGRAEVRNVFKITGSGIVAGSYVTSGKIYRNSKVRVFRGTEVVFEGALKGLKRFKDDVKEVAEGYECGISVEGFSDVKELDVIEAYSMEQI
jgi:translation initiation factor IF-2